jgi:hypothetical protein
MSMPPTILPPSPNPSDREPRWDKTAESNENKKTSPNDFILRLRMNRCFSLRLYSSPPTSMSFCYLQLNRGNLCRSQIFAAFSACYLNQIKKRIKVFLKIVYCMNGTTSISQTEFHFDWISRPQHQVGYENNLFTFCHWEDLEIADDFCQHDFQLEHGELLTNAVSHAS